MAIEILTGGTQQLGINNGQSVSLLPPTLSTGDVVVVFGGHNAVSGQSVVPTGNNSGAYQSIYDSGAANPTPHFGVYYQIMGATPDTSISCPGNGSGTDGTAYACFCLRNVDGAVVDQTATSAGPTGGGNPDCPSIVTQTDGALVLALALDHLAGTGDVSITNPTGYTEGGQRTARGADNNDATVCGGALTKASYGTEDPPSFTTWTTGTWRAVTVAIRPGAVVHDLLKVDLEVAAPVETATDLAQQHALSKVDLEVAAPTFEAPTFQETAPPENYELFAVNGTLLAAILDAKPVVGVYYAVTGATLAVSAPVETAATVAQKHILAGEALSVVAPVLVVGEFAISQVQMDPASLAVAAPVLTATKITYNFVGGSLAVNAPILTATKIVYNFVGNALQVGAPVLTTNRIVYNFVGNALTVTAPVEVAGSFGQKHALLKTDLAVAAPVLGVGNIGLNAEPLQVVAPVLTAPSLSTRYAFLGQPLQVNAPVLTAATLTRVVPLQAASFNVNAPVETAATVGQRHAFTGQTLQAGAPVLTTQSLGQKHVLAKADLAVTAPVLAAPAMVRIVALSGAALAAGAPVLSAPTLAQNNILAGANKATAAPQLQAGAFHSIHALLGVGTEAGAPLLGASDLREQIPGSYIGADLSAGAPILLSPRLEIWRDRRLAWHWIRTIETAPVELVAQRTANDFSGGLRSNEPTTERLQDDD